MAYTVAIRELIRDRCLSQTSVSIGWTSLSLGDMLLHCQWNLSGSSQPRCVCACALYLVWREGITRTTEKDSERCKYIQQRRVDEIVNPPASDVRRRSGLVMTISVAKFFAEWKHPPYLQNQTCELRARGSSSVEEENKFCDKVFCATQKQRWEKIYKSQS